MQDRSLLLQLFVLLKPSKTAYSKQSYVSVCKVLSYFVGEAVGFDVGADVGDQLGTNVGAGEGAFEGAAEGMEAATIAAVATQNGRQPACLSIPAGCCTCVSSIDFLHSSAASSRVSFSIFIRQSRQP